jgi:hypothetical protein
VKIINKNFSFFSTLNQFFPHIPYVASKNPSVTRCCRPVVDWNLYRRYLSRLKGYRFEIWATLRQLGWIDAPHTHSFDILTSLEQTQESKKCKISFEFFVKMLDGLNFGKRCHFECSVWNFYQNWKFLKFS